MAKELTEKQKRFCLEYIKDLNATQAAIRTGYSANTAQEQGSRLLSNVMAQHYICQLNDKRIKRLEIDADFVLDELYKIANSDIGEMFNEDGTVKLISEIPKYLRKAISSFEVVETFEKEGRHKVWTGQIRKVKLWSKDKSLENLGRHLKLFVDKVEHQGNVTLEQLVNQSMKE